jgi:hypothetical protein
MKDKFFKKLLAIYYIIRDRSKYKHYLVYTLTCDELELENPTIYDVDRICEKMNEFHKLYDETENKILKTIKFKNIVYDREDIKLYQGHIENFKNALQPKLTMQDCSLQLYLMSTTPLYKLVWEVIKDKC